MSVSPAARTTSTVRSMLFAVAQRQLGEHLVGVVVAEAGRRGAVDLRVVLALGEAVGALRAPRYGQLRQRRVRRSLQEEHHVVVIVVLLALLLVVLLLRFFGRGGGGGGGWGWGPRGPDGPDDGLAAVPERERSDVR